MADLKVRSKRGKSLILKIGEEGSTRNMTIEKNILLQNPVSIGMIIKVKEINKGPKWLN